MSIWDDPDADPLGDLLVWAKKYREMTWEPAGKIFIARPMLMAMVRRYGVARTRQAANNAAQIYGFSRVRIYCYR